MPVLSVQKFNIEAFIIRQLIVDGLEVKLISQF